MHYGDLSDGSNINRILEKVRPDEIYHLGAQSHVRVSFDIPEYTGDVSGLGTLRILDAIRETGIKTKFYQASSSEMFGKALEIPLKETTPFYPRSPYGVAKVYAYWITKITGKLTIYLLATVFFSITNHQGEARLLLLEKLPAV